MEKSSEDKMVSAEDLLAKMRAGTKAVHEIKMRQLVIPVRILSLDEELDIRNRMIAINSRKGGDGVSLAALVQKETIKTAAFLGKGESSLPERLFEMMSRDELIYLYNEYIKLTEEMNPGIEQVSEEQFEALVTAVKKNTVTASDLSLAQLRAVFLSYQHLIQTLDFQASQKDSSAGGPS